MGDFDSSECSWKKMVIAKSNNEWVSTIKTEQLTHGSTMEPTNFQFCDEQMSVCNIKLERQDDDDEEIVPDSDINPEMFVQELNPLLLEETVKRRRRKGSGPKCESPEERAVRLAKMSAYAAQRIANETPEQRALRLRRMSEYAAKRLSNETSEQRAKRLARMSEYAAKRLAKETPEQRQARLTRMSQYAARRHAQKKNMNYSTSDSIDPTQSTMNISMPSQS